MRCKLILPLFLICAAATAEARDITGQMTYRERIALPEGAVLRVQLRGEAGIVAEVSVEPGGRQVPLPFALTAPDEGAHVLQGAIFVGNQPQWVSDPVAVAAGTGALDLGPVNMTQDIAKGFMWRMRCGAAVIEVGYLPDSVRLQVRGETLVLPHAMSGSGARFSDDATPETVFWNKGDKAMLTLRGETLPECAPMIDRPLLPLTARGNEPFWRLDLTPGTYAFEPGPGEVLREGPLPPAGQTDEGVRVTVDDTLAFAITRGICRDTMTGMPHPLTVAVSDAGRALAGCGGLPADLLAGDWTVTDLAGTALADDIQITMTFDATATSVSGAGGCNRFNAGVTLTGEGLSFAPAASTMMACPEPQMAAEQGFHQALASVDRFDIGDDGTLELLSADTVVIRAVR